MPASSFFVPVVFPGQTPDANTRGPQAVFVDYTSSGDGGGTPTTPTTGQIWPRGQGG